MPHYRITYSRQAKGGSSAPVLWFVPMSRDMFPEREFWNIEAPTARESVIGFMAQQRVEVGPAQPVRESPILHRWLLSRTVTIGDYIDSFLNRKRRSLVFRARDGVRCRILSVEDVPEPVGSAAATGPYQQQETSNKRPATSNQTHA
jgi:hypothetical protein